LAPRVQLFLELVLDDLPLLLDDEDLLEAFGEAAHAFGLQRPGHRDLVQPQADVGGHALVDSQVIERLAHVEVGLAAGDDAQSRPRRIEHHAVEPVGARVRDRGVDLVLVHPPLLHQLRIGPAQVQPVGGQDEVVGQADLDAMGVDLHRGRALDRVGGGLQRHPAPGVARHSPAVQPEVEAILDARRREHRNAARREHVLALVRDRRRARGRVVAGHQQHATVLRASRVVGVLQHVDASIDAGPLAVPHREDAVVLRIGEQVQLLRAPYRGRCEVFVDGRMEADPVRLQEGLRAVQRGVEAAERRSAIPGHVARGVQARRGVALLLQHRQAGERLHAGQEDPTVLEPVLVVERNACKGHDRPRGRRESD
jgi:hypothetical protein